MRLLGSLSGFDGDHFIYFLGATSVARGERPLRDFVDAGFQGAWPALTCELSALAQWLGGETLLSEAVLCVGAIALSATSLVPGGRVRGWRLGQRRGDPRSRWRPVTLSTAITRFSCLRSPSRCCCTPRAPSTRNLCLMAVWSAVAFLVPARLPGVGGARHRCRLIVTLPGPPLVRRARVAGHLPRAHGTAASGSCLFHSSFRRIGQLSEQQHRVRATRGRTNRLGLAGLRAGHGTDCVVRERGQRRFVAVLPVPASAPLGIAVAGLGQPRLPRWTSRVLARCC